VRVAGRLRLAGKAVAEEAVGRGQMISDGRPAEVALARLRASRATVANENQKNGDPLVPLANLLQWPYAIDQWHKNRIADGENELVQLFGQDVVGETYNGYRAARMSVAHDLSLVAGLVDRVNPRVVQVSSAGRAQIITPPVTSVWQWTQTPTIPPNNAE
jgi:hypothetical protein